MRSPDPAPYIIFIISLFSRLQASCLTLLSHFAISLGGTGGLNLATILIGQDVFTSTSVHVAGRFLLAACFTTSSSSIQDTLSAANETIPLGLRSSLPRSHCILFPCVDAVNLKMTKCWNISGWTRLAGPFRVMLIPCLCGFAVNDLN